MAYTFDSANATAPTKHGTQYFEMVGNRAIYHDGWVAATTPPSAPWLLGATMPALDTYHWELYNVARDFSENNDLAAQMPDKLKEMQALFLAEAAKYQVFPLDNSGFVRMLAPKPSAVAGKTEFTYTGVNAGIPFGNAPSILDKNYTITAEITIPEGGAEGMIVTMGGRFGGYALYLLKGKPVFDYNLLDMERFRWEGGVGGLIGDDLFGKALKPGKHTIMFDFKYNGPGPGKGGTGVLSVDGKEMARKTIAHSIPLMMTIDENMDIGLDTGTGVDDSYELPFKFTGTIDKLTYKLGPSQMVAADQKAVDEMKKSVNN
jgi:arylsulfatase